ncbi:vesicle transport V-snare protein vti1a, putative [Entamoeba dispar SAW760]|uniref:Vesicle transport V-snare protein vti1a, putative n=1 Tax=Entamoeba dispar (strain ATCC PRA-260 / SAW760) TaxID=370354 RepID=B0ELW7_ENTDS|nr:vesicle transport V-snare protein vti1a, putative [Entamoeba dispar SAW760]XP_001741858.1 vesicle transport V-snare protein vti1a, putative [Entamoeba dispar SAW760]EDR21667.1 vesicle transport V-snare protein vti1a, putative [Entamoeba dispar SAW760]EDR24472.1 vesicle transport V-snare protein vti1a, putative [Entamoeba dispar SAW760]|eukprot:EDR21667.1 vesicle transport V-snare protein vti1a, putative [Entamoeba dispar SAW760]
MEEYNQAQSLLQQQNDMLSEALVIGRENEQIGAETHQMLVQQGEQLRGVNNKLDDIDSNVTIADSKLKRMTFRLITDKFVQIGIIALLIIAILLVIFIKWILPLI